MSDENLDSELIYNPSYEANNYDGTYPLSQIEKVRKYLIDECLTESRSKLEVEIKRKCGILNRDVINYFLHDQKSEKFIDSPLTNSQSNELIDNNPFVHKILNIDEDDLVPTSEDPPTLNTGSRLPSTSSESTIANSSQISESKSATGLSLTNSFQLNNFLNNADEQINRLNKDLKMMHGCDAKFCPRHLPVKDTADEAGSTVFVCDFCDKSVGLKSNMNEHLNQTNHPSASEYILESKQLDSATPSSSQSSYDQYFSEANSKRKIKYLKKRSSLKNLNSSEQIAVFCPTCGFYFSHSILAAGLHFKYYHCPSIKDLVYTWSTLDRTDRIEVEKAHTCFTCHARFKKLTALISHLENTKHFPLNKPDEINVFKCPFDDCDFRSTKYFSFKTHIVNHAFFNKTDGNSLKIDVKVNVFKKPKLYFHITEFKETNDCQTDRSSELEAIEDLLELSKNHLDATEMNKKVRERKNKIFRYNDMDKS